MAVRGNLQDLDLISLLQMTCEEGGDAQISLQRGVNHATLYIQQGQIVHAEGDGDAGADVVYKVLGWRNGTFALARNTDAPTPTIESDWNNLLLEGLRRLDEQGSAEDIEDIAVRHKSVLAVSDTPATLETLSDLLKAYEKEFALLTASTQEEGLALLKQHQPDLLVLGLTQSPATEADLLAHLVGQRLPVPLVVLCQHDHERFPTTNAINPVLFLTNPPDEPELVASLWAQIAREAAGNPVGLTLYALCEWLRLEKRTCLVRVQTAQQDGMIAFVDGVLLNAVCGQKLGEAAVKTIFAWEGITIEFAEVIAKIKPLIQRPLAAVLGTGSPESDASPPADPTNQATWIEESQEPAAPESASDIVAEPATDAEVETVQRESGTSEEASDKTTEAAPVALSDEATVDVPVTPSNEATLDTATSAAAPETASDTENVLEEAIPPLPVPTDNALDTEAAPVSLNGSTPHTDDPVPSPAPAEDVAPSATTVSFETPAISHTDSRRVPISTEREIDMSTATDTRIDKALQDVMQITGAMGVALVDITSGMALGKMGSTNLDLDIAAAGNSEVVKAKLRVMKDLGIRGEIEDILITLSAQYHLIRPLGSDSTLFLYVVLSKETANLALARRQLSKIESTLTV